ncbi:hypothetical protein Tco_0975735 [Tanacetum coccineum]|uniref:Uncharacterized protein n=1 Tax=Tanacetum coccineum TaxID=301880 RepID=A0ABQ5EF91_9ASTR
MNKKSYSFDMETFRSMLMICLKPPGLKFEDPPFEEEIITFIRELGYSSNIKLLTDVKVDTLPQPWRTFGTIINKCLNDLVFQIKNKESRKNKYMFYPRFTKVIINYFMSQDQSIPRRNKVDWHMANDDPILTTMRFIPQHEVVQRYGAILPDYLTYPAMKVSEAYKTYHNLATGKIPWKSSDEDDDDEVNVSEHEDDDDDERTDSDNDGDEFVHLKFTTHDDEARQEAEVNEEDSFDPRVQTPSHVESTDDEDNDDEIHDANFEGDKMNEEETYAEDEANVLYMDVNINLIYKDEMLK